MKTRIQETERCYLTSECFREYDREQAELLFDRAIEAGYNEPEVYLRRARIRAGDDDLEGASKDALKVLQSDNLPPHLVRDAILWAMRGSSVDRRGIESGAIIGY